MTGTAAIVVTHNRLMLLKECIQSIRDQAEKPDAIIVVDNGSAADTVSWLNEQQDLITIHQGNTGGAGGFYTGIKTGIEKGFEFLWLMDDDTIPDNNCLHFLKQSFTDIPGISFAASLVFNEKGGKNNVSQIDFRPDPETAYPDWAANIENGYVKIREATFVSLLISSESVRKVGLPIKEFFIWGDDYEYTYRLSEYKPGYLAINSRAVHKNNHAQPPLLPLENDPARFRFHFYGTRNRVYLLRKQRKGFRKWFGLATFFLTFFKVIGQPHGMKKAGLFLRGYLAGLAFNPAIDRGHTM